MLKSALILKETDFETRTDGLYEIFKINAEAVGAEVFRFETKKKALAFLSSFLVKEGVKEADNCYAVWADSPFLNAMDKDKLSADVPGLKFKVTQDISAKAKVGISELQWALADTGTTVQNSLDISQRLVSTLTEVHIAIINTTMILPDLMTLMEKIKPENAAYFTLITGPSRTSDIERVLTIGVHGPERLIVVFVDK